MAWLIAGIIIVVTLVFVAGFRKSALGLLIIGLLVGCWIYQHNQRVREQAQSRCFIGDPGRKRCAQFDARW